jgi:hypothetical protein
VSTRRCAPVCLSSYAATPFVQDEDIINGTSVITNSISGGFEFQNDWPSAENAVHGHGK